MKAIQSGICFISTSPRTLWLFYRGLIAQLCDTFESCSVITPYMLELDKLAKYCTCTPHVVPISRAISPFKDLKTIFQIARYLRKGRFAIVHAHTPKGGLVGIFPAILAKIPVRVYTMHGLPLETAKGLKYVVLWLSDWCVCKCATRVLAVSPSLRQKVIEKKICPADKIEVLGKGSACGIDIEYFRKTAEQITLGADIRKHYGIADTAIVFGYIGRIGPEKGIAELVAVFKQLQKEHDVWLFLVGEIEMLHGVLSLVTRDEIKSNERITILEHLQDVRPFYAAIDMLVLPTLREGLPIVLLEAAAMEIPVVATRVTGCVDAVVDEKTGILVEKENPVQLFSAVLRLVKDAKCRKHLGQSARKWVLESFDSARLVKLHMEFYEKLLK